MANVPNEVQVTMDKALKEWLDQLKETVTRLEKVMLKLELFYTRTNLSELEDENG